MSITYYSHTDGIKLLAKMLYDEKLTPIIGAGFTRNCSSKKRLFLMVIRQQRL